ncbi:MAG TPA: IS1380 family transposase [Kineosporiaceae bacterium]|nr:IS1380 family transposase [Kineosporiaceae bacterium]
MSLRGRGRAKFKGGRQRRRRVRIGAADASLTGSAGVAAVAEVDRVLGLTKCLDRRIPGFKQRDRGLTAGQTLTAIASCQLAGGDHLVSLDARRADTAGQELEPVPTPASTTATGLAKRFTASQFAGIEAGVALVNTRVLGLVGQVRRSALLRLVTLDIDATDIEVYGRTKNGSAYNYQGQRAYRADIVLWAELGVPLAADLLAGNDDPRSSVVNLIRRTHAGLPSGIARVAMRLDAGYFAADAAIAAHELDIEFAIGVKRNAAVWRAAATVPDDAYTPVIGMDDTEVAVIPYAPKGWPPDIVCLARRTRIAADQISTDPRARKRRTVPKDQLALALDGQIDHVYGYSFILTNRPVHTPTGTTDPELLAEAEHWYRHRTDIEALNKDAKHGAALRHMPSADTDVNRVWMWAALLATAISAWLQEITSIDCGNGRGRRTITRLRRELINIPARLVHTARTTRLRLPPGPNLLTIVLPRLQALPSG